MLYKDIQTWLARKMGKEDPHGQLGKDHFADKPEGFWALKDLEFEIREGDRVGIIGRNGAGKSTLLKLISRITSPSEGTISMKGTISSLLEVGTGFHPELTGRENVFLNGAILGMSRRETSRRLDEIIAFSEIEQFIDTPVKRYSSGMYVRLGFSVAAHLLASIMIVDEVLAVGDIQFQKKCISKLKELGDSGRTILFVSHNLAMVNALCNKGLLLQRGKMLALGDRQDVVNQYLQQSENNDQNVTDSDYASPIRVKEFRILTEDGIATHEVKCGDTIILRTQIVAKKNFDRIRIGIAFHDHNDGSRISYLYSSYNHREMKLDGVLIVDCIIPHIPLIPGFYRLTLKIENGETELFNEPGFSEISVLNGDFYSTGALVGRDYGGVVAFECSWKEA